MNLYEQIAINKRKSLLIMGAFTFIIAGLAYVIGEVLDYGGALFLPALIIAAVSSGFSYFYGDKVALTLSRAQKITKSESPRLFRTVENLSIGAGIVPMPAVYLIPDPAINAFATGRDPKHSSIAVTSGAIEKLSDLELEGVVAHELNHITNYDIRTMAIAVVLVGIIAMISEWFLRFSWGKSTRNRNNSRNGSVFVIIAIIGTLLAPLVAQLLKFALSRQREYLADTSGALLTRYPEGLASALEKIQHDQTPLQHANSAVAHLFIANPFGSASEKATSLFSTHPPITERIHRLRQM